MRESDVLLYSLVSIQDRAAPRSRVPVRNSVRQTTAKSYPCWITRRGCTLATEPNPERRLAAGGKRRHLRGGENPASERTSQKLNELLRTGVADGDARAELLKLAVRKIIEEAL